MIKSMKLGIVDYGMGNLMSVSSALDVLGSKPKICKHPEDLENVDKIILVCCRL